MKTLHSFTILNMIFFSYGCMPNDAVSPQSLLKEESKMAITAQTIFIDPDTGMPTTPPVEGGANQTINLATPIILDKSTESNGLVVYTPRTPVSQNLIARQDCLKNIRISHQHSIDFSRSKSNCSTNK